MDGLLDWVFGFPVVEMTQLCEVIGSREKVLQWNVDALSGLLLYNHRPLLLKLQARRNFVVRVFQKHFQSHTATVERTGRA